MNVADTAGSMIRVLITDDHPVMRHGLRAAVSTQADMAIVGEATNGREAIEKFRELRPSVALMDLQMPDVDGLEAIGAIRNEFPDANIIVLTSYPGDARIMRALMLGATSYLLKSSSLDETIRAIRASMAGRHVMDPDVAHDLAVYAGTELLTAKEIAVLALVAQGHANKMIAGELFVSEETVKSRMRSILSKLDARDRTHAVMLAIQRGFLQP
ncbi:response regulator [Luteibacter sp. E-22]|uniref:response regulator transcription factor n=1 Tax=Luteibacter sp. E-22 TaxID=3404050 RepID=UPI003CF04340